MKTFKDSEGKEWILALNIGAVKRLRDLAKVDFTALNEGDPPLISRLSADIVLVCDVLYVLCKDQADAIELTDEQFAARLGGDAIRQAWEALQDELIDFFRQLGRAEDSRVIEANRRMIRTQSAALEAKIGELDQVMQSRIQTMADRIDVGRLLDEAEARGKSSTSSPASSESIPTR